MWCGLASRPHILLTSTNCLSEALHLADPCGRSSLFRAAKQAKLAGLPEKRAFDVVDVCDVQ